MFRKLFSYILPITIHEKKSSISKSLEVTWANGELVLDSKNTNYSYGSLQRILRKGLKNIGFERVKSMENILVLGVAGGSVIKTLVDEVKFKGNIIGVEIDKEIIELANDYFKLNEIPNLKIFINDAFDFVLKSNDKYDLIIIDIFQDTTMPNFLFEKFFMNRIGLLLNPKGVVLFNTMILNEKDNQRNKKYVAEMGSIQFKTKIIPRVEEHNELIVLEK
jgi:predicted membrane-bound spermidine synthase